jgi:uncharacterized membrane protein
MNDPLAAPPPSLETMPFAVLVDEAWKSSRRHARRLLVPAMVALAPAALGLQVVSALWSLQMFGADPAVGGGLESMLGTLVLVIAAMLLVGAWFVVVYGTLQVATVEALARPEAPPTLAASARVFARPRVWGTDILAWMLIGFGTLACLLPGLLLLAAWSLRLPVMVREGRYGFRALQRSWELLAHNPGRLLSRHPMLKVGLLFLLGMVLGYAVNLVIQLPAIVVSQVVMFRELAQGEAGDPAGAMKATLWLTIPSGVLAAMAQLSVQLYLDFAVAHLYFDQRRRKEGADLAAGLDQLLGAGRPSPLGEAGGAAAGAAAAPGPVL